MINITLDSLLQFLRKHKYEAEIQKETEQVYTILKFEKKEYPLFLRVYDEGNLLQLLVFIPSHLTPNENFISGKSDSQDEVISQNSAVFGDLGRLLHLLNKDLDLPGFGMDEVAGIVFYRLMLPAPKKKIDPDLLHAYIQTIERVCQMFSPPIEAVSSGKISLEEIIAKAREIQNP